MWPLQPAYAGSVLPHSTSKYGHSSDLNVCRSRCTQGQGIRGASLRAQSRSGLLGQGCGIGHRRARAGKGTREGAPIIQNLRESRWGEYYASINAFKLMHSICTCDTHGRPMKPPHYINKTSINACPAQIHNPSSSVFILRKQNKTKSKTRFHCFYSRSILI